MQFLNLLYRGIIISHVNGQQISSNVISVLQSYYPQFFVGQFALTHLYFTIYFYLLVFQGGFYILKVQPIYRSMFNTLKLIIMLINRVKNITNAVFKICKCNQHAASGIKQLKFGSRLRFCFSKWEKEDILKQLEQDILESTTKIMPEHQANLDYFTKNHWKIDYNQTEKLYVYGKVDDDYEVKVLTKVKYNPPNELPDQSKKKQAEQFQSKSLNYSEANIFIKKKGSDKWLAAQMGVFEGFVQVVSIFFTHSEPCLKKQIDEYHGPELSTIPQELRSIISDILIDVGLPTHMIMNMVINSSNQVDKLDVQWLKDIKDLWI